MEMFFSGRTLGFYPLDMKDDYESAGSWPDDAVKLTQNEKDKYWLKTAPVGKMLGCKNSKPCWVSIPPPTKAELTEQAELKKQALITEANQKTQLWQTQLMLGIITDEDKASLTEWMLYVQKVQAVDTSTAPDIIWPEKPE